jgi:hypothetical protein
MATMALGRRILTAWTVTGPCSDCAVHGAPARRAAAAGIAFVASSPLGLVAARLQKLTAPAPLPRPAGGVFQKKPFTGAS